MMSQHGPEQILREDSFTLHQYLLIKQISVTCSTFARHVEFLECHYLVYTSVEFPHFLTRQN